MPITYLVDTSAWHRFGETAPIWRERLAGGQLAVCPPVALELLYSAKGPADYRRLARDLQSLPNLELTATASAIALETQAALAERSQHRGPTPVDLLVAAIAQARGARLVHYDRHFDAIARVTGQRAEWVAPRGSLD